MSLIRFEVECSPFFLKLSWTIALEEFSLVFLLQTPPPFQDVAWDELE